eukprot:5141221-Prymnesium_polylepis.2
MAATEMAPTESVLARPSCASSKAWAVWRGRFAACSSAAPVSSGFSRLSRSTSRHIRSRSLRSES